MRAEADILKEMQDLIAEAHDAGDTATVAEVRERTARIQALRKELSDGVTEGAEPCSACEIMPHGMHKNAAQWEIGCLVCGKRARTGSREACVADWNAQQQNMAAPKVRLRIARALEE